MHITHLEDLRAEARALSDEVSLAEWLASPVYSVGYVRFAPETSSGPRTVTHEHLDVLCLVISGEGTLALADVVIPLRPGVLCQVPAGTPHDFTATSSALEMLYATIRST